MENSQIAQQFDEIADLLELQDKNEFRIRSYRNAARTIRDQSRRLEDMVADDKDLTSLPNIGDSTAEKIREIIETGTSKRLEEQREKVPRELVEVMRVPNVGPKTAMQLHEELDIDSLDDLRKACEEDKVKELEGMGEKTQEQILDGIETLQKTSGRILLQEAQEHAASLKKHLDGIKAIQKWVVAGSYRRQKETVGDLDILIQAQDRQAATDAIVDYDAISDVDRRGKERVTVHLDSGLQVDFRFFESRHFGSAMMYFTGSKAHNIALRKRAQDNGWKLNEYGLSKDDNLLAGKDEESIYHRLNLSWVPPEMREDRGEIEAAENDAIPDLLELGDIRGDLQSHTTASDGNNSIREMGDAAAERGYQFFAITDHSQRVTMAGGLDEKALGKHAGNIRRADNNYDDLWLMAGIEVDILKSGKLDLKHEALKKLDWVVASVHYDRNLSEKDMTDRIIKAIETGVVHCLAHPLGRIIGKRDPISVNFERVVEACVEHNVCLEVNAQPDRLDLPDTYIQQAKEAGVMFTIGTDAHKTGSLDFMQFGVAMARRGWLERGNVLNTKTTKQLRKWLEKHDG
jgi:DNA polymerase (family 10)